MWCRDHSILIHFEFFTTENWIVLCCHHEQESFAVFHSHKWMQFAQFNYSPADWVSFTFIALSIFIDIRLRRCADIVSHCQCILAEWLKEKHICFSVSAQFIRHWSIEGETSFSALHIAYISRNDITADHSNWLNSWYSNRSVSLFVCFLSSPVF